MTPLSAVPSPADDPSRGPVRALASVDDDFTAVDDWSAAHQPSTDPEALLLSALMWSNHPDGPTAETQRIVATVTAADFDTAAYARLYEVIAALVAAGEQHDPASVTHALARAGSGGPAGDSLRHRLTGVATAGGHAAAAAHYADMVLAQAYRRSYRTVGESITQAADELPEEYLFEHMIEHGRAQRALWNRLNAFRGAR
ncbi:DnaB-like helicase N-terminal domain-containing protein [Rhodococcus sp. IEGM 1370]|jgi:replicative DNA helicase|uniref:DnaB-like helicase N-terminal domain-containing protein n=1 Tax=Rhodococcus sp. IEGM 1370 TaxID=3082222 RepID=UPI0029549718|nr:DnaB-like helicase N-terminal domain-containing protein [Rhodococcus sp. IEGM 1370]MDV8078035.1 DnaB-like helicase N-terminal domain-containing protein [Rhodococcus sp. IEGM 1370]